MKIIISDSTISFIGRNFNYSPNVFVPQSGLYPNRTIIAGYTDWRVKGSDKSITFAINDFPSSAIGKTLEVKAILVQPMSLEERYKIIDLGIIAINASNSEVTLELSGLNNGEQYYVALRSEIYLPYSTNNGHPYKAFGGSIDESNYTFKPSEPNASGDGSYGAFVPALIKMKVNK